MWATRLTQKRVCRPSDEDTTRLHIKKGLYGPPGKSVDENGCLGYPPSPTTKDDIYCVCASFQRARLKMRHTSGDPYAADIAHRLYGFCT